MGAPLDFVDNPADRIAHFSNSATNGQGFTIQFDADVGQQDEDTRICSQSIVPENYDSLGALRIRYSKAAPHTGIFEEFRCGRSVNGDAPVQTSASELLTNVPGTHTRCSLDGTEFGADDALSIFLQVSSQTAGDINDPANINAVEFEYLADS